MSGWSKPFAKRVLDSWAIHSRDVGAEAVADRIRKNIKAKALQGRAQPSGSAAILDAAKEAHGSGSRKAASRAEAVSNRSK